MSAPNDGGPAFPVPVEQLLDSPATGVERVYPKEGMTLRDWFAGQIISQVHADYRRHAESHGWDADWQLGICIDAYRIADAMLAARKGTP